MTSRVEPGSSWSRGPGRQLNPHRDPELARRLRRKLDPQGLSPHVPDESGRQPFPEWKRIDVLADALSDKEKEKVAAAGGTITKEEYPGEEGAKNQ